MMYSFVQAAVRFIFQFTMQCQVMPRQPFFPMAQIMPENDTANCTAVFSGRKVLYLGKSHIYI